MGIGDTVIYCNYFGYLIGKVIDINRKVRRVDIKINSKLTIVFYYENDLRVLTTGLFDGL